MNTLAMTDKLKAAGIPEEEARAHIAVVQEATDELVTKADMRGMIWIIIGAIRSAW